MNDRPITPYPTAHLFSDVRAELLHVLRTLRDDEWAVPTACPDWSVRDVALHVLADDIGYLSRSRDLDGITLAASDWDALVAAINTHNDLWVQAARRMSRVLLVGFLEMTGEQMSEYLMSLPMDALGQPISWAGIQAAPLWLQAARELSEHWMHAQHIFDAVGVRRCKERRFLHPMLATFMHALPRTYAAVAAPLSTTVQVRVTGEASDSWFLIREVEGWALYQSTDRTPTSTITADGDTAWRIFTKGIERAEAEERVSLAGDVALAAVFLDAVGIIA